MSKPLITVIVPIYHVEKYLHRCVDSILNQTYENLEIILVDDGSGDACSSICDEYAGRDSRIVVIHKENGGLSDARNAGIEIAKGQYLAFVDSDDYIHKDMYKILMKEILESNAEVSICSYKYVYDNKEKEIVCYPYPAGIMEHPELNKIETDDEKANDSFRHDADRMRVGICTEVVLCLRGRILQS